MFSAIIGSFIRWALGMVAGWLANQGVTCADVADYVPDCTVGNEQQAFTGVLLGVGMLAWSWWQKRLAHRKLQEAIEAPAGLASKKEAVPLPWQRRHGAR